MLTKLKFLHLDNMKRMRFYTSCLETCIVYIRFEQCNFFMIHLYLSKQHTLTNYCSSSNFFNPPHMQLLHILMEKDVTFAPLCDPLSCKVPFYIHLCMYFSSIFVPVSEVLIWVLLIVQFYADICHML